jgi:hypothetical protein
MQKTADTQSAEGAGQVQQMLGAHKTDTALQGPRCFSGTTIESATTFALAACGAGLAALNWAQSIVVPYGRYL